MRGRKSFMLAILIVGIVSVSGFGPASQIAQGGEKPTYTPWLSSWRFRKAHNITGSPAGAQVNYPIQLSVWFPPGTDEPGKVYLGGECRADFGDVRFTDAAGGSLNYWIQEKIDGAHALFWVSIDLIPQYPDNATMFLYYGNANASTTSNKNWTFDYIADFEDGTTGTWSISWPSPHWDGVTQESVFQGNFSRGAEREYGKYGAGENWDSHEKFKDTTGAFLSQGSYRFQGAARFVYPSVGLISITLLCNEAPIANVTFPDTTWQFFGGNLTIEEAQWVSFTVEFDVHVYTGDVILERYCIDSLVLRKWCDPSPMHGSWSAAWTSEDNTPPNIASIEWTPTSPPPFVPTATPRQGEPVAVRANVTDIGGGVDVVHLSYRMDAGCWCNVSMTWNATSGLWDGVIPGYSGNHSVEFFITAMDFAGNLAVGEIKGYVVRSLLAGDIDGDRDVDIYDIVKAAGNYGRSW